MPKEYPALMVEDDGYAAILRGHGLPTDALEAAEIAMIGKPEDGWFTQVEEVCFDWVPRVKWCSRHPLSGGWSCDQEGEWHGHWFEVRETDIEACHFTIIRHTDLDPNEVTGSTDPSPEEVRAAQYRERMGDLTDADDEALAHSSDSSPGATLS